MISTPSRQLATKSEIGIGAISIYRPAQVLPNAWFETIPRKFVKHTGILNRHVSWRREVEMAIAATENLVRETGCNLNDCVGVVFSSPSFVPIRLAQQYLGEPAVCQEQIDLSAHQFVQRLQLKPRRIVAKNSYCVGFAEALSLALNRIHAQTELQSNEFILVLTTSRISRITNYSCSQSSALFGDMAAATLVSRIDSNKYPVRFELVAADVQELETNRPFFDFSMRQDVTVPTPDGGKRMESERIVFSLDGMGIADTAPRAMAAASRQMLDQTGWRPEDVDCVIPHQAGSSIVRFSEMKLREAGFTCDFVNDLSQQVGNVSSCSIPFALRKKWQLVGNILCPVAGVGVPGQPSVMQGCIALRALEPITQSRVQMAGWH